MTAARILITAGSARTGSFNTRLAAAAAAIVRAEGAEVTQVDLRALGLPLYDGDVEAQGLPEGARELRRLFASHDGLIVSSPEYNGFVTPLLVNAIDWTSRVPAEGDLPSGLDAMAGTVAGLVSASPGGLGGMRSVAALRLFLTTALGFIVVPATLSVGKAHQAFADDGSLADERQQRSLVQVVQSTIELTTKLSRA